MQLRTAQRDLDIYRQNPISKRRSNIAIHPCAQPCGLRLA
jgi:hypothetical protein